MTDPIDTVPTLAGFIAWSRVAMGIPTTAIADDAPGYAAAYQVAIAVVPTDYAATEGAIYTLTVYNWAGSQLIQFQHDIRGQSFFEDARRAFGVNSFVAGVVNSASDEGTSESLTIGKGLQNLSLMDMQRLKDPYGRQALAFMQTFGTLWGLS